MRTLFPYTTFLNPYSNAVLKKFGPCISNKIFYRNEGLVRPPYITSGPALIPNFQCLIAVWFYICLGWSTKLNGIILTWWFCADHKCIREGAFKPSSEDHRVEPDSGARTYQYASTRASFVALFSSTISLFSSRFSNSSSPTCLMVLSVIFLSFAFAFAFAFAFSFFCW